MSPTKTMTLTEVLAAIPQDVKALNLLRQADRGDFPHYIRMSKKSEPLFNRAAVMDFIEQVYGSVLKDYRMEVVTFPFATTPKVEKNDGLAAPSNEKQG